MDVALDQANDLDNMVTGASYRGTALTPEQCKLDKWSEYLGDKPFLAGEVSVADCKFYEILRKLDIYFDDLKLPENLSAYMARFAALPPIAAYLASPAFRPRPINNPHAKFR